MFKSFRETWHEESYLTALKVCNVISFAFLAMSSFLIYGEFVGHQSFYMTSEKYLTWFTPVRFSYGVLGISMFLQFLYVVYQALPGDAEKAPYIARLNFFLAAAWLFEAATLWSVVYDIIWLAFTFSTLTTLNFVIAYFRLNNLPLELAHVLSARIDGRDKAVANYYYLIFYAPTSLNLAWSFGSWVLLLFMMLHSVGIILPVSTGIIGSVLVALISFVMLGLKRDVVYAMATAWITFAVAVRFRGYTAIEITNYVVAGILALASIFTFVAALRKSPNLLEKENIETYRSRTNYQTGIHTTETSRLVSS